MTDKEIKYNFKPIGFNEDICPVESPKPIEIVPIKQNMPRTGIASNSLLERYLQTVNK